MSLARLRALIVIGVLVVCATVLVAVAIVKDRQADDTRAEGCAANAVPVNLKLPSTADQIKVRVLNGTDTSSLASQVAEAFRSRKVQVVEEKSEGKKVTDVAVIRYGPSQVGAAWLVNAYFLNEAKLAFDINRKDDVIDVVVGTKFKQLGSFTESNQALAVAGNPPLPEGTCDANAK
ncbi:hypothetical protein Val02_87310 [Virgisporangium aliadipatigenens]|uniref:LytR/CpsA/Psr regulator C-terminal domain-containing protein n=1 Tax=Virgisporangium aliadipatigenens TaxID=741659 RepID=A0A8J3YY47_9ACTN|nr:LytR C-terminal domain-containing protein [Virgisporangium aliadipatigenens]GIJ51845.1 hypothetical protein Val02_87310 [Virgisporangium aliadipatigenens]